MSINTVDSLYSYSKTCKTEIEKNIVYLLISDEYLSSNVDSAKIILETVSNSFNAILKSKTLSQKDQDTAYHYLGKYASNYAYIQVIRGDLDNSILFFEKSISYFEKSGNTKGVEDVYSNLGYVFKRKANIDKALEYYFLSLTAKEKNNDKEGIALANNNIAIIFFQQKDTTKALNYFLNCLKIYEEIKDKHGISLALNNIGYIYDKQDKTELALEFYMKSIDLKNEINFETGKTSTLINIGNIYQNKQEIEKALEYYNQALAVALKSNDKSSKCRSLLKIGGVHFHKKNMPSALSFTKKAYFLAKEIGDPELLKSTSEILEKVYFKKGDYKKSLMMNRVFNQMKDSLFSEKTIKQALNLELKHDYDKKKLADSLVFVRLEAGQQIEIANQKTQLEKEKNVRLLLYFGLAALLLFALVIYRGFRQKSKSNIIINEQKKLVDIKNKEITDSINYALRIQQVLLKTKEEIAAIFPPHFILFKPKDIVSGDFYWATKKEEFLYVAVADCTGHGVPGAFMSLLGISFLNEINAPKAILSPSEILDKLRDKVIKELNQTGKMFEMKDGMDISLLKINLNTNHIEWAGANNSLYVVNDKKELVTIPANNQPISFYPNQKPFTNHSITPNKNDTFYLFTDGYVDQFGGGKGKKYMRKRFKQLLIDNNAIAIEQQKELLENELNAWQGKLEQLDDICVIGIKIT